MHMLIDIDRLENSRALPSETIALLRQYAVRETGHTAINVLLVFGALAVAAGMLTMIPQPITGVVMGFAFILCGASASRQNASKWGRLGGIAMIIGALVAAPSTALLVGSPFIGSLTAAIILAFMALLARSRFLSALVPFALAAALGGSTGYWHACYELCISEPTITIGVFTVLAIAGWEMATRFENVHYRGMAVVFARICVILANFGFWIGSLWGDAPGHTFRAPEYAGFTDPTVAPWVFIVGWAMMLMIAGIWGVRHHRRFMVNTAVTFAAIHSYTQWFEYFHLRPDAVIFAGFAAIALGMGLWHYNQSAEKKIMECL